MGAPADERTSGGAEGFTLKVATDGTYGWVRRTGGMINDLAVDSTGEPIAFGQFDGAVDFGSDFSVSESRDPESGSSFAMRINADGSYDETLFLLGTVQYRSGYAYAGCVDGSDGVRMVGYINGVFTFADDWAIDDTRTYVGATDGFVSRLKH